MLFNLAHYCYLIKTCAHSAGNYFIISACFGGEYLYILSIFVLVILLYLFNEIWESRSYMSRPLPQQAFQMRLLCHIWDSKWQRGERLCFHSVLCLLNIWMLSKLTFPRGLGVGTKKKNSMRQPSVWCQGSTSSHILTPSSKFTSNSCNQGQLYWAAHVRHRASSLKSYRAKGGGPVFLLSYPRAICPACLP